MAFTLFRTHPRAWDPFRARLLRQSPLESAFSGVYVHAVYAVYAVCCVLCAVLCVCMCLSAVCCVLCPVCCAVCGEVRGEVRRLCVSGGGLRKNKNPTQ